MPSRATGTRLAVDVVLPQGEHTIVLVSRDVAGNQDVAALTYNRRCL